MLAADHMYHHHEYATILSKILKIIIPSTYRFHDRKEIIFFRFKIHGLLRSLLKWRWAFGDELLATDKHLCTYENCTENKKQYGFIHYFFFVVILLLDIIFIKFNTLFFFAVFLLIFWVGYISVVTASYNNLNNDILSQ